MGYLKNDIKELEKEFVPSFEYKNNPMFDIYPELPISIETVLKCINFYSIEGENENFEKSEISLKQFNPKNKSHKFKLDYDLLNKMLDSDVFEIELKKNIDEQKNDYYLDLKQKLEKCQNDITFKIVLSSVINLIKQSITVLEGLSLNNIQKEVSKLYLKSYNKLLFDLKVEYSSFCPELFIDYLITESYNEKDFFSTYFFDKITVNKFVRFEEQLIKKGYLDANYHWIKDKILLVRFFKFCVEEGLYKKYYNDVADVLHQLERRYTIDLGDQSKPSKFKNVKSFKSEFSFLT